MSEAFNNYSTHVIIVYVLFSGSVSCSHEKCNPEYRLTLACSIILHGLLSGLNIQKIILFLFLHFLWLPPLDMGGTNMNILVNISYIFDLNLTLVMYNSMAMFKEKRLFTRSLYIYF